MPSLTADSAASIRLMFIGMCFIAYFPPLVSISYELSKQDCIVPTMAEEIKGSVGVSQAATASAEV
jgi:hypothetical protein